MIDTFLTFTFWKRNSYYSPSEQGWHLAPSSSPAPTASASLSSRLPRSLSWRFIVQSRLGRLLSNLVYQHKVTEKSSSLKTMCQPQHQTNVYFGEESRICKQCVGVWETQLSETWDDFWISVRVKKSGVQKKKSAGGRKGEKQKD